MKINVLAVLTVTAMCLSLCSCSSQTETNTQGTDVELGASPSTEATTSAASKTVTQPGNITSTTVGKTEAKSERTTRGEQTTTTRALEVLHRGNAIWKEVPIKEEEWISTASFADSFDLREVISTADYVFSGTIINRKEYEVSWTDKKGEHWGPYESSLLEVKVDHDYYGHSPTKNNIIKIYYPYSLSTQYRLSVSVKEKGEYVFITRALDKKYVDRKAKEAPGDGYEAEKYADVYVETPLYNLLPIDNGNVISYKGYFNWNKDVMKKAKTSAKTDKIPKQGVEKGFFTALDKNDFNKAFVQLFKNPQALPTASTWAPSTTTTDRTRRITTRTKL